MIVWSHHAGVLYTSCNPAEIFTCIMETISQSLGCCTRCQPVKSMPVMAFHTQGTCQGLRQTLRNCTNACPISLRITCSSWTESELHSSPRAPHLSALQSVHEKRQVLIVQGTQWRHLTQRSVSAVRIVTLPWLTSYPSA